MLFLVLFSITNPENIGSPNVLNVNKLINFTTHYYILYNFQNYGILIILTS
jgi:hypothetical protein